jgi:PKD repeat protein
MKRFSLLFLLFFALGALHAQNVSVSGVVSFGESQEDLPGYPVQLTILDPTIFVLFEETTDDNGQFQFDVEYDFINGDAIDIAVQVFDLCTGEMLSQQFTVEASNPIVEDVFFTVCSDINPPPPPTGCEAFFGWEQVESDPFLVQFFDLSYTDNEEGPDAWFWDFGDGNTSDEQEPLHEYAEEGDYDVILTVVYDTCVSTVVQPVHVTDLGFCNCEYVFEPVCVVFPDGTTIPFINECEALCAGFGDDVEITEDCEGDGPCGCLDLHFPTCVLTADGDTLFYENPCLAACDGYGEDSYIECENDNPCGCDFVFDPVCVTINGILELFPNPCFAACAGYSEDEYGPCEGFGCFAAFERVVLDDGFSVEFIDMSETFSAPVITWEWDFGDGNTSDEPNPIHTYTEPGNYDVTLTIVTEDGCTSVANQHVCIGDDCIGDCDCPDIFDPVCVLFGDEIITLPNACFAYCFGFEDEDFVECEEDCVCPDIFDPVCVLDEAGNLQFFENPCFAECEGYGPDDYVDCDGYCPCDDYFEPVCVVTADGDTLNFDNPCFAECEGYGPDQYFPCDLAGPCGCYEIFDPVCVLLDDGTQVLYPNDCYAICDGFTEDDFVDCDPSNGEFCVASFDFEIGPEGQIFFYDQSFSLLDQIISWSWDFGDGNTSNEQNPVHTYDEEGLYEVILTIITAEGCASTTVILVDTGDGGGYPWPDCQALFFFEQSTDVPFTFQFIDFSIGEADSWSWDFGDGNTSNEQNPVHTYTEEGAYFVTLTITAGDCSSTMPMLLFTDETIWYPSECMALFLPLIIPDANEVVFLNLSSADAVSYEWDFGDGNTSDEQNPIYTYAEGGMYEISLTITTADGCQNTFSVTMNLDGEGFTGNPQYLLVNDTAEEPQALETINAYPNPFKDQLVVEFEAPATENYTLRLYSIDGKLQYEQRHNLNAGLHRLEISTPVLASGMYFLQVQSGKQATSIKLVKE